MFKISIAIGHEKKNGGKVKRATLKKAIANAVNTLTDFYGGATITETRGAYYDTREKSTLITSFAKKVTREQKNILRALCSQIADTCTQDSVLLAVENVGGFFSFVKAKN